MIINKYEHIIRRFETYYPNLYARAVDWWATGRMSIAVKLNDGVVYDYDSLDDSIRRISGRECVSDESDFRKTFGSNLQKMLPVSGLTKGELAEKVGITNAMLSRYIRGNSTPSIFVANKIANVLNCRLDAFLDDTYD